MMSIVLVAPAQSHGTFVDDPLDDCITWSYGTQFQDCPVGSTTYSAKTYSPGKLEPLICGKAEEVVSDRWRCIEWHDLPPQAPLCIYFDDHHEYQENCPVGSMNYDPALQKTLICGEAEEKGKTWRCVKWDDPVLRKSLICARENSFPHHATSCREWRWAKFPPTAEEIAAEAIEAKNEEARQRDTAHKRILEQQEIIRKREQQKIATQRAFAKLPLCRYEGNPSIRDPREIAYREQVAKNIARNQIRLRIGADKMGKVTLQGPSQDTLLITYYGIQLSAVDAFGADHYSRGFVEMLCYAGIKHYVIIVSAGPWDDVGRVTETGNFVALNPAGAGMTTSTVRLK